MSGETFSIFQELQEESYCGPCSMSYCFFILGKDANQHQIADSTGLSWWQRKKGGCDELALKRAASAFGVKSEFLIFSSKNKGGIYIKKLKEHISNGFPAILSVDNFNHWIALLGYSDSEKKFIINDPIDKNILFSKYNDNFLKQRCWNVDKKNKNIKEYFAILLSNKDHKPARWTLTDDFIKLCAKGSAEDAKSLMSDLLEITERAKLSSSKTKKYSPLSDILKQDEDIIVDCVNHWSNTNDMGKRDLRELYRDFIIVSEAANICIPKKFDSVSIVSQMTAILCAAIWNEGILK
ncbi:C39 family peptidase [Candidatus Dependentiae bacterium]|nr:C39 family peptidase [Candidatus Dependentiae bacterium]